MDATVVDRRVGNQKASSPRVAPLLSIKPHPSQARPKLVARPRLIESLMRDPGRELTFLSAPAGFGKSTFLKSADQKPYGRWSARLAAYDAVSRATFRGPPGGADGAHAWEGLSPKCRCSRRGAWEPGRSGRATGTSIEVHRLARRSR